MNGSDELSADHFWDAEDAEKEYHRVERGLAEAGKSLERAQGRLLTVQAVYDLFSDTLGVAAVENRGSKYSYEEESILNALNLALNPYWLPEGGKFEFGSSYGYRHSHAPWQGSLVAAKVVSETVQDAVYYGR